MALSIYKSGQGYYTRMLTAVGAMTLVAVGVVWLGEKVNHLNYAFYWQAGIAVALIGVFGGLLWYLLNKPRIADFLIATEAEMKKVNWPTRREILGSTWVVICGAFLMAAWLWIFNLVFAYLFARVGVIES